MVKTVFLGLGSNLGDRVATLQEALDRLDAPDLRIVKVSSVYETEPVGFRDQPWFANIVVEAEADLFPRLILNRALRVELELGRKRIRKNGPRTLDIDVLSIGRNVILVDDLEVPHPRMHERRFVLEPLAEIAPGWIHPVLRLNVQALLAKVSGQAVTRLGELIHLPSGSQHLS